MTNQKQAGSRVGGRFVHGALLAALVSLSLSTACEASVVLGEPPDENAPALGTCTGDACSDALVTDVQKEGVRDASPGADTSEGEKETGVDGSTAPEGAICGLDVDTSRIVDGVLRAAVRSLYETLSHSGEVRPTVALFPGRVYLDDRVTSSKYRDCQPVSRRCGEESVDCHGTSCLRCRAVECGPGSGVWSFSLWGAPRGGVESPLRYTTRNWRVEYASAPGITWDLSLTFSDSIDARTEVRQQLQVSSRRTGETYDASFWARLEGSTSDVETSPNRLQFEIRLPSLPEKGRYLLRTSGTGAVRPSGRLVHEIRSEASFRELDQFTIVPGGERVEWVGDCSSF